MPGEILTDPTLQATALLWGEDRSLESWERGERMGLETSRLEIIGD